MRRRNILKDDEAVSPVIATILMVAITVVLAATLYMMLPGGDDAGTPVAGSLSYRSGRSSPTEGQASFDITLQTPSSADPDNDVQISVLDDGGEELTEEDDFTVSWSLLDNEEVTSGSRLNIEVTADYGDNIRDYEVVIRIDGYSSNFGDTVG